MVSVYLTQHGSASKSWVVSGVLCKSVDRAPEIPDSRVTLPSLIHQNQVKPWNIVETSVTVSMKPEVRMRVVVDFDLCESNALCMATAPEVFEARNDDTLYVLNLSPPEAYANNRTCSNALSKAGYFH